MFCRTYKIKFEPCTFNKVFDSEKKVKGKKSDKIKKKVILNCLVEKEEKHTYILNKCKKIEVILWLYI